MKKLLSTTFMVLLSYSTGYSTEYIPYKPKQYVGVITDNYEVNPMDYIRVQPKNQASPVEAQKPIQVASETELAAYRLDLERRGYNPNRDTASQISDEGRFIVVNIPAQNLRVFEGGVEVLRTPVIVGNENSQTPVFRTRITGIKLNPSWTVPPRGGIERRYTQKVRSGDVEGFKEIGIEWSSRPDGSLQFWQPAGPDNVLGQLKFEMHSPNHVYLHDTNRRDLFGLADRTISNGCVRVKGWDHLAAYVLGNRVSDVMTMLEDNTTRVINVSPISVYFIYHTEEIMDGVLVKHDDIYDKGRNRL